MRIGRGVALAASILFASCGSPPLEGPVCLLESAPVSLPESLSESSGVAVSLQNGGVYWTHNDVGRRLVGVDASGASVAEYTLDTSLTDWEDIGVQMCPTGGSCLYLADLGDNYERRAPGQIRIIRLPEPEVGAGASPQDTLRTEWFPLEIPGGARDIEALIVLPGERVYLVSKGRNQPVTVYRYPGALRPDTVLLEEVQLLSERPRFLSRQISGAAVDPETGIIAVRSYGAIQFFRMVADSLAHIDGADLSLNDVQQGQGEGVGFGLGGLMALTAEEGPGGAQANLMLMRCRLGDLPG